MKERLKRYLLRGFVGAMWLGDSVSQRADSVQAWADSLESDTLAIQRVAREEHGMIREGEIMYRFVPAAPDSARSK